MYTFRQHIGQAIQVSGEPYRVIGVDYTDYYIYYLYSEERDVYARYSTSTGNLRIITHEKVNQLAENGEMYT